jgi:hypothetical protein
MKEPYIFLRLIAEKKAGKAYNFGSDTRRIPEKTVQIILDTSIKRGDETEFNT